MLLFQDKLIGLPVASVQSTSYKIMKLYVKPRLGRGVANSNLIIDRSQIVKVSDQKVTVKSTALKELRHGFSVKRLLWGAKQPAIAPDALQKSE